MTLYLGWQRTVVLVGYDAVKEALVDQADDFTGRGPLPFLVKVTKGYGKTFQICHLCQASSDFSMVSCLHVSVCRPSWSKSIHFLLSGLGISNGDRWRQLRRFTLTTLRDFGMGRKGMEEWIQEESKHLRGRIDTFNGVFLTDVLRAHISQVVDVKEGCCIICQVKG